MLHCAHPYSLFWRLQFLIGSCLQRHRMVVLPSRYVGFVSMAGLKVQSVRSSPAWRPFPQGKSYLWVFCFNIGYLFIVKFIQFLWACQRKVPLCISGKLLFLCDDGCLSLSEYCFAHRGGTDKLATGVLYATEHQTVCASVHFCCQYIMTCNVTCPPEHAPFSHSGIPAPTCAAITVWSHFIIVCHRNQIIQFQ